MRVEKWEMAMALASAAALVGARAAQSGSVQAPTVAAAPAPSPPPAAPPPATTTATDRRDDGARCANRAGALARDTLDARQGGGRSLPIRHVIVVMQENRSFDHYFGRLPQAGQPDVDGIPAEYRNPDGAGRERAPFHLGSTCLPADPPHQWDSMHAHWNGGRMDGFVAEAESGRRRRRDNDARRESAKEEDDDDPAAGGRYALGYYDQRDLPFYYHLADTFTVADRYFSSAMAGTWPNRQFLYTATAHRRSAPTAQLTSARTIFDNLDAARIPWAVYADGLPRQDCIGWSPGARGVRPIAALWEALRNGSLPAVAFVDSYANDEHPPADAQRGERWLRQLYVAATRSPQWKDLALFLTYDEGGGLFDHVPPPLACPPSEDRADYDRLGTRVPMVVVSPWARRHHVSHVVYDHTSLLRFIELLFDLPALTARDANADPLLDAFDFDHPAALAVPAAPAAGVGGCRPWRVVATR
jgi:phospholipase C